LIEHQEFDRRTGPASNGQDDTIFRYCNFGDLSINGSGFDGGLIDCVLRKIDWYWGLFSSTAFLRTRFDNCTFRGSSFMGCRLLECHFSGCDFLLDNLGGACSFEDCAFVECTFDRCQFILDNPIGRPVFAKTRWYSCTQTQCVGLDGLF